jgi:hypothetical protein
MISFVSTPTSHIKCIVTLSKRNLLRFYRDKMDLSITFGQAPILAIAFFLVFKTILNFGEIQSFSQPLHGYLSAAATIIIFLSVLTAIWFGTSKAITEIPRNRVLYQQEHLSFLNNFDFIISNFISLAIILFGQVFLFAISFHLLFIAIPALIDPVLTGITCTKADFSLSHLMPVLFIKLTLLMWLIGLASIAVATLISIFVKTPSAANSILPFVLIIQILLGGSTIKPVIYMNIVVQSFSNIMVSRWGFESAILLFEDQLNLSLPCPPKYFTFTKDLKSTDPKLYIETLKKEGAVIPSVVKQHPDTLISILWIYALSNVDDVKNGKGFYLPSYQETFDKVSAIYPHRKNWSKELSQKQQHLIYLHLIAF